MACSATLKSVATCVAVLGTIVMLINLLSFTISVTVELTEDDEAAMNAISMASDVIGLLFDISLVYMLCRFGHRLKYSNVVVGGLVLLFIIAAGSYVVPRIGRFGRVVYPIVNLGVVVWACVNRRDPEVADDPESYYLLTGNPVGPGAGGAAASGGAVIEVKTIQQAPV